MWPVRAGQQANADASYPSNIAKTGQTIAYAVGDDGDQRRGVDWPTARFIDNGDGTIADTLTQLTWLQELNCIATQYPAFDNDWAPNDGGVTWQHAIEFVNGMNAGTYSNCAAGLSDWRLPNSEELRSLVDYSKISSAIPQSAPFTLSYSRGPNTFWSATTYS